MILAFTVIGCMESTNVGEDLELGDFNKSLCPLEAKRNRLQIQFEARVLFIQIIEENMVYFEGKKTHKDSIYKQLLESTSYFTKQERETYQVALLATPETGMRIISDIKEQIRDAGTTNVIYQMTENLYEHCSANE
jgi:biopolymer transport protein ExbD